jgi:hypothetical protein
MKWYKHFSNAHSNFKVLQVVRKCGFEGYGLYWLILEFIAEQGENYILLKEKCWKEALQFFSGLEEEKIKEVLNELAQTGLINLEEGNLSIPQMKEYVDSYTEKVERAKQYADKIRTMSEQSMDTIQTRSDFIPLEQIRLEQIRLEQIRLEEEQKKTGKSLSVLDWKPTVKSYKIPWHSPTMIEILRLTDNEDQIDNALNIASEKGKGLRYALGVLKNWQEQEFKEPEESKELTTQQPTKECEALQMIEDYQKEALPIEDNINKINELVIAIADKKDIRSLPP